MGPGSPNGLLRPYLLIGCCAAAALALLYAAGLFYLQFLLVVWAGAVMAGIAVYEKRAGGIARSPMPLADADRLIALEQSLAETEVKLMSAREKDAQLLRAKKAAIERELRKLKWSIRESGLDSLQKATGGGGLEPLPPRLGARKRRGQEKREQSHLLDSLDEAEEVLASEPPVSARARLELIAADVKAHYGLLRDLEYRSRNLGDYGDAWAALASIARGVRLDYDVSAHASKKVRARLEGLFDLAVARGLVSGATGRTESPEEDTERWK